MQYPHQGAQKLSKTNPGSSKTSKEKSFLSTFKGVDAQESLFLHDPQRGLL